MPRRSCGEYPQDWPKIAQQVKDFNLWLCERCGHPHDIESGYMLTVHHLDLNVTNNAWWNLAVLCQRCHLHIQHRVVLERMWMFEHTAWFKPHAAGYYAHIHGHPDNRDFVLANLESLLDYGRPGGGQKRFVELPNLVPSVI